MNCKRTYGGRGSRLIFAGLLALSTSASAQAPREAMVTRETQDLYRAGITQVYYLKTQNCNEQIYGDRVTLRWNLSGKGGVMIRRGPVEKVCFIEKVLKEVDPKTMQLMPEF